MNQNIYQIFKEVFTTYGKKSFAVTLIIFITYIIFFHHFHAIVYEVVVHCTHPAIYETYPSLYNRYPAGKYSVYFVKTDLVWEGLLNYIVDKHFSLENYVVSLGVLLFMGAHITLKGGQYKTVTLTAVIYLLYVYFLLNILSIFLIILICGMFIGVRASFPRYRYDQLMFIGGKYFLPLTLGFLTIVIGLAVYFGY